MRTILRAGYAILVAVLISAALLLLCSLFTERHEQKFKDERERSRDLNRKLLEQDRRR